MGAPTVNFLFEARDADGILRGQKSIGAAGNKFLAFQFPMTLDLMISASQHSLPKNEIEVIPAYRVPITGITFLSAFIFFY